ncbi:MAG: signal recognition particle-docking protein FtsY [Spirochaetaceae bacterium]|jgi:fused signal recognition particle receptor|nr:signal recognition particle-docking protein FtsY [Spirochaetaceae bacterium]
MKFAETIKNLFARASEPAASFFDDLADVLVEGDFPAASALETAELLQALCKKEKITTPDAIQQRLAAMLLELVRAVDAGAAYPDFSGGTLTVILLLGVNGVGKTSSAAKLAALFREETPAVKPLLAAADTFRAAAVDQLKIHGERLGVRVVAGMHGGDSAACVYDALAACASGGYNPLIADTAGRMHTKTALVDELKKIARVIQREPRAVCKKYLVLDATTGSNALVQAETFSEAVEVDGVILTKCDSSAKGGIVFPLAEKLHLPVLYLCSGEQYANIQLFNAEKYISAFLGA